jgi:hypothetical protein
MLATLATNKKSPEKTLLVAVAGCALGGWTTTARSGEEDKKTMPACLQRPFHKERGIASQPARERDNALGKTVDAHFNYK